MSDRRRLPKLTKHDSLLAYRITLLQLLGPPSLTALSSACHTPQYTLVPSSRHLTTARGDHSIGVETTPHLLRPKSGLRFVGVWQVREGVERGRQWGEGVYGRLVTHEGYADAMATLDRLTLGLLPPQALQLSPEARLRAFEFTLVGKDLAALREVEQRLRRSSRERPTDPDLPMQLKAVQLRQRALKPRRRGWFY